tara:strand:- start:3085 stop:3312 length:228 start_codon:yes stop_codon:yes gene_type:complete
MELKKIHKMEIGDGRSNCCGAIMYADLDLCPECLEHCDTEIDCSDCKGTGKQEFLFIFTKTCENCNGEGWIIEGY